MDGPSGESTKGEDVIVAVSTRMRSESAYVRQVNFFLQLL